MGNSLFGVDILSLVQVGFHGAALVVLLISAYLLRDYSQRVLTIDKEKQDIRVVEGVRKLITTFMGVSVLFFFFGVGAQIYSNKEAKNLPYVRTVPTVVDLMTYDEHKPTIMKGGAHIDITPGQEFEIKDGEGLFFSVKGLTAKLSENESTLKTLRIANGASADGEAGI